MLARAEPRLVRSDQSSVGGGLGLRGNCRTEPSQATTRLNMGREPGGTVAIVWYLGSAARRTENSFSEIRVLPIQHSGRSSSSVSTMSCSYLELRGSVLMRGAIPGEGMGGLGPLPGRSHPASECNSDKRGQLSHGTAD